MDYLLLYFGIGLTTGITVMLLSGSGIYKRLSESSQYHGYDDAPYMAFVVIAVCIVLTYVLFWPAMVANIGRMKVQLIIQRRDTARRKAIEEANSPLFHCLRELDAAFEKEHGEEAEEIKRMLDHGI